MNNILLDINDEKKCEEKSIINEPKKNKNRRQNRILKDNKFTFPWIKYAASIFKSKNKKQGINSIRYMSPIPEELAGKLKTEDNKISELNDPDLWTLPKLLFFDPITQFPGFQVLKCPKIINKNDTEIRCNQPCTIRKFHTSNINKMSRNKKRSNGKAPRFIYSLDGGVELITVSYNCKNGHSHNILSESCQNKEFLNYFINTSEIILTKKFAFTEDIQQLLLKCLSEGFGSSKLDEIFREMLFENYLKRKIKYIDCCKRNNLIIKSFPGPNNAINETHNHLWSNITLHYFKKNKEYFDYALSCLKHNGTISDDHTFKICKKITIRINKKRYQLSGALYVVLSNGVPVAMRYTDTKSPEDIKTLHEYLERQLPVKLILSDQCCTDKNWLLKIHPNAVIKLDLWHAYDRVVKGIAKKQPYRREALNDLKMIFYIDGEKHNKKTETIPIIRANFLEWEKKYNYLNSKLLSSQEFKKQKKWILSHINKGCLSLSNMTVCSFQSV